MRTHLLKVVALCTATAFLGACNKESTPQLTSNKENTDHLHPIEQLRSFQKQMKSIKEQPNQRNQETMSLSDALWDVENLFNITYSDPNQYYDQTSDHEFIIEIPLNNNQEVDIVDAVNLYDQIIEETRFTLSTDPSESKSFVSLLIEEPEMADGYVQVKCIGKTGDRSNYNPPTTYQEGPFTPDDNWLFAAPMGKCDDPDIPSGADKQLQEKLYDKLIEDFPEAPSGQRNIFINRKRFVFDGVNTPGIFYTQDPEDICIDFQKMNALFLKEKTVIGTTIPEQYHLYDYTPISIEISGIQTEDGAGLTHRNEVEYGQLYQVSKDEFGEVKDLLHP